MTRVALLTISDRPDLLAQTMLSLQGACGRQPGGGRPSPFVEHVHVDDQAHRLGFAGAIRHGWNHLRASPVAFDYVLHLEDDWRFDAPLELERLAFILQIRRQQSQRPPFGVSAPDLAQVALRRNAVAPSELAAGGVVELWPDAYTETMHGAPADGLTYLEHDLYFTTNPSLYRRDLLELEWPDVPRSEEAFSALCREAGYRFALYGARSDPPRVTHLGDRRREGKGY